MAFVPNRWLTLRLRFSGPFVICKCSDNQGHSRTFSWDWRPLPSTSVLFPSQPDITVELQQQIESLLKDQPPTRWGESPFDTAPLPVFIDPPPGLPLIDLQEQFLKSVLGELTPGRVQCVFLSRAKSARRAPFQLPLEILTVGDIAPLALTALEESSWYVNSTEVREFGVRIRNAKELSDQTLRSGTPSDIVVADAEEPVLESFRAIPEQQRPRLLVLLEENFLRPIDWSVPSGVALLRLPQLGFKRVGQFLRAFTYGIIHDFPLHEALSAAIEETKPSFIPLLIANPTSNQGLRISEALAELKRESDRLEITLPLSDFGPFLTRLKTAKDPELQGLLPNIRQRVSKLSGEVPAQPLQNIAAWTKQARSLPFWFSRERLGLVPIANLKANFLQVGNDEAILREEYKKVLEDSQIFDLLRTHQQRFVDVALSRMETDPFLEPLTRKHTLQRGRLYQLRVHIGNRSSESLVVGPDVPIDPLLPDPGDAQGHFLEITVQAKDFRLSSPQTLTAWLPTVGAAEPVYFQVRAPETTGTKELRICVYSQNHLIQTYRLTAQVTESEVTRTDTDAQPLSATLEFSRTEEFSDLDRLKPRALSIGANSSSSSSNTHELIIKGDQTTGELTLFPGTFDPEVKQFRDILEAACRDPKKPNVCRTYPVVPPGQAPGKDVSQTFRDLAKRGRGLYDALFSKASRTTLRPALVKVAQTSNQKLQVIRFDENFVFPWAILYDFPLPKDIHKQQAAPVCLGIKVDAAGNTVSCNHTCKERVYCVNGFWGVRHYVEELIGQGTNLNPTITRTSSNAIRIVADANLGGVTTLITNLTASIGQNLVTPGPVDPDLLLDILWDTPQRPSILIVLGHLKKLATAGEPEGARVVLVPQSKWLLRQEISERSAHDTAGWCQPRSMILMMACESAATEVETVNDFVTAWNTAGAGAIIGTECIVGSALAAELAEEVTKAVWNKRTLGEAMTDFRRKAVNQGNPLGLIFHAVGDVDLTVN